MRYKKTLGIWLTAIMLILCIPMEHQSQSLASYFIKASCKEKSWFVFHPLSANKAIKASRMSIHLTDSIIANGILDTLCAGGKADAFRHGIWMALMVQKIPAKHALKLGEAHEKTNYKGFKKGWYEDGVLVCEAFCKMDLQNNKTGVEIGNQLIGSLKTDIASAIIKAITEGRFKILAMTDNEHYFTCNGELIDLNKYKSKWEVPICIVSSDWKLE